MEWSSLVTVINAICFISIMERRLLLIHGIILSSAFLGVSLKPFLLCKKCQLDVLRHVSVQLSWRYFMSLKAHYGQEKTKTMDIRKNSIYPNLSKNYSLFHFLEFCWIVFNQEYMSVFCLELLRKCIFNLGTCMLQWITQFAKTKSRLHFFSST